MPLSTSFTELVGCELRTSKKVKAPISASWFGSPTADSKSFQPHPTFGFVCPALKPDVDTP